MTQLEKALGDLSKFVERELLEGRQLKHPNPRYEELKKICMVLGASEKQTDDAEDLGCERSLKIGVGRIVFFQRVITQYELSQMARMK